MLISRLALLGTVIVVLVAAVLLLTASRPPVVVEQPLPFSHKLHAGENQIPCLYCHGEARRSAIAGVPAVSRCIGCHRGLKVDTPAIQTLKAHWEHQQPIPWVKVYDQPDFVRFSHKRHVLRGITCQTCHGEVQTMEQVRETVILNMDRCVTCHLQHQASIDCLVCHK
jgi:hypothetical protein